MTPALIDLSNYAAALVQSTVSRADSDGPDGNIFFDTTNGRIEIITAEELAMVDLGSGPEANPLTNQLGIKLEALYAFENQERRVDENLRKFDRYFKGTFKFGGAYELINGRKFDDVDGTDTSSTNNSAGDSDDRCKIRGSGWIERNTAGAIGRIYYGVKSLGNIEAASQPYYQLSAGGAPVNFAKAGDIDEAIQVYGDAAIDINTTTFDTRTYLSNKVRTFGYNYDEKILADSGVTEMGGYSSGFALGESAHLTSGAYSLADVYGVSQISPWTGMGLEELDTPQVETGFTTADGSFTWVVNNTVPGTLNEVVAFLDALAQTDDDINDHVTNVTNGKRVGTWYTYSADGKIQPRVGTGAAGEGLFIEGLVGTDKNRVIFTDDSGATKVYPAYSNVSVTVGADAVADTNAWFHAFFLDGPGGNDYNTINALTVEDASAVEVKGNVNTSPLRVINAIAFEFDWYGDTIGGPIETNKDCVFLCEGDGGVTQAKTIFTLTSSASISASCTPLVENNV